MNLANKPNDYQKAIDVELFEKCPKAVFAGIAASFILNHLGKSPDELSTELLKEWYNLHMQGIIPQAPPKKLWPK